jgi:hypothetical protein
MVVPNDNQDQVWEKTLMFHNMEHEGVEFNHAKDDHRLAAGTFAFVKGEPVTVTSDNGIWIDWVPGHVILQTTNFRGLITLEP